MGKKRDIKYDQAYLKYLEGYSTTQVGKMLGVSRQAVLEAFKVRGLKLRGASFNEEIIKL